MTKVMTIHTLPVLRNEIKNYNAFDKERQKVIVDYVDPLKKAYEEIQEIDSVLVSVKSPGKSDGLGGYVMESDVKFNEFIEKKDRLKKQTQDHIRLFYPGYISAVQEWNKRIATVEHYLSRMKDKDREFIEDLYISDMSFRNVMGKYEIMNEGHIYRKANNILKKLL